MKKIAALVLIISWCWPGGMAYALSGKGTTAASFLKIGVGSRAVAIGESYVAVADDPSAVYWNPAGIAGITDPAVMAMHVFWLGDIYFDYLAGVLPMPGGGLGASLVYLNHGQLLRSDAGDTPDDPVRGVFTAADFAFSGAYGYQFSKKMKLGATVKLFSESIDSQASFGAALDLGFLYELPWQAIMLGVMVQNLGPATQVDVESFRLPLNFKIGLSYHPMKNLLVTMDYNQLLEQEAKIGFGAEYVYEHLLALRAGYQYQGKIDQSELYSNYGTPGLAGLTAGIGIKVMEFSLDYAYVPYGFLGTTHRLTLTYALSQPPVKKSVQAQPAPAFTRKQQQEKMKKSIEAFDEKINTGVLKSIQFESGNAVLLPESQRTLDSLGRELAKYPDVTVSIDGYTDNVGRPEDNQVLSQLRVESVKTYLVDNFKLNPNQLVAVGHGEEHPIASNDTAGGRQKNRRVEFKVISDK